MENSKKYKSIFMSQYWGQDICFWRWEEGNSEIANNVNASTIDGHKNRFIKLKSLSSITNADLKQIGFSNIGDFKVRFYFESYDSHWTSTCGNTGYLLSSDIDYLRSKGYAVPFRGLSIEQMEEWGWIKLIE